MPDEDLKFSIEIENDVMFSLFRIPGRSEIFSQLKFMKSSIGKFDENRLALIAVDGQVVTDFCTSKAFDELCKSLEQQFDPIFFFEEAEITSAFWHGKKEQGLGPVEKILNANKILIRAYLEDYTIKEFEIRGVKLETLKRRLKFGLV